MCQTALVGGLEALTNVAQKGKFKRSFLILPGAKLSIIGRSQWLAGNFVKRGDSVGRSYYPWKGRATDSRTAKGPRNSAGEIRLDRQDMILQAPRSTRPGDKNDIFKQHLRRATWPKALGNMLSGNFHPHPSMASLLSSTHANTRLPLPKQ